LEQLYLFVYNSLELGLRVKTQRSFSWANNGT
jgi:hypothetical protein